MSLAFTRRIHAVAIMTTLICSFWSAAVAALSTTGYLLLCSCCAGSVFWARILVVGVCGLGPALERVLLQCGLSAAFTLQRSVPVCFSLHRHMLLVCSQVDVVQLVGSMPALPTGCTLDLGPGATCLVSLVSNGAGRAGLARVQTLVLSCAMPRLRVCCVCTTAPRSMCVVLVCAGPQPRPPLLSWVKQ